MYNKKHFRVFSEHVLSSESQITSTDLHATPPHIHRGTSVLGDKKREFHTSQVITLELIKLIQNKLPSVSVTLCFILRYALLPSFFTTPDQSDKTSHSGFLYHTKFISCGCVCVCVCVAYGIFLTYLYLYKYI